MRRFYLLTFYLFFLIHEHHAQETNFKENWTDNTAYTLPAGKWESGIFQSFRYGLNDRTELRSNAFILPLLPNAGIKFALGSMNSYLFACEHSVSYPTFFLKMISFKGTGGLISPQFDFPFILSVSNSLIISKLVGTKTLFSADLGLSFAIRNKKPDYQSTIDLPLVYPRMAHFYEGISIRTGFSCKGIILPKLFYEEKARLFIITRNNDNIFAENTGSLLWVVGKSFRLKGGYILSWGKYPFGNQFQLWPAIDIIFGSNK